jgi:hypothetical protein
VKRDVARTIRARVELLLEEWEAEGATGASLMAAVAAGAARSWALPHRLLLPLVCPTPGPRCLARGAAAEQCGGAGIRAGG